jgi:lipopolysaccharide transport system ATP-binding protein
LSQSAVVFEGVWKRFRRGERHDSLRDLLPSLLGRVARWRRRDLLDEQDERCFWAVQDVSFRVSRGEALGIIGRNGAGKSTTLKLLTRILRPTRGVCSVQGRVGALIEVASGFHPDLTGRENVFLQGAIMGMKRREIAAQLAAIVEFSGVEAFIDTPVKRYSSGMNARLGFSIAAHLDPDVLIIDEVLSVGDMQFQERCVQRMLEFKRRGVTIVFVSHNLQAVSALCDRALFLANRLIAVGPTHQVLQSYTESLYGNAVADDDAIVAVVRASLTSATGGTTDVPPGTPLQLSVTFAARRTIRRATVALVVRRSTDSIAVYNANFGSDEYGVDEVEAGGELDFVFDLKANVTRGTYHVECILIDTPTMTFLNAVRPVARFSVGETRTWSGIAHLDVAATAIVRDVRSEAR